MKTDINDIPVTTNKYRIFWNPAYPHFWYWHDTMCKQIGITTHITVNCQTLLFINDEQMVHVMKAKHNGIIERILDIEHNLII